MKNKYIILDINDASLWKSYLNKLPANLQDIYYMPEFYELYKNNGDGDTRCFIFEEGNSFGIYPFLINSINNLGYNLDQEYFDIQGAYGYNGVLSNDMTVEFRRKFYDAFNQYCIENNIVAEFTRFHPINKNHLFSDGFLSIVKDRNTVYLDLSKSYEDIWENEYSSKNRNMIRKAKKKSFEINYYENPSIENILAFTYVYQTAMNILNAEKYYMFSEQYFLCLFDKLKKYSMIFEVLNEKKEIECASIIFILGSNAHYHLSGRKPGSDNSVNNFILDAAIKYAKSKGVKSFHFGGGTTRQNEDPLLKFKSNFSKEMAEFFIGRKVHNEEVYNYLISKWESNFPERINNNILLRYRL